MKQSDRPGTKETSKMEAAAIKTISVNESQTGDKPSDIELVRRCQSGSEAAFQMLYERHFDSVFRLGRRLAGFDVDAEDLAQEVFCVVHRKVGEFRGDAQFTTWLYRITAFTAAKFRRKRKAQKVLMLDFGRETVALGAPEETPERELRRKQAEQTVHKVLEKLSEKKRVVLVMFELEQMSGEEISTILQVPIDTVWTRLFHARRDFARQLKQFQTIEDARGAQ